MELNPQTIEYIKNKVSILDVISPYVSVTKKGNRHVACCPFHNEKTPSFSIDLMKNIYHCFGCGVHGDAISFLMEYSNLSFVDAVKELASKAGVEITISRQNSQKYEQKKQEKNNLFSVMESALDFFCNNLQKNENALSYVKSRKLSEKEIKDFEIGYSLDSFSALFSHLTNKGFSKESIIKCGLAIEKNGNVFDMFRNRIMFPIKNIQGKVIAFGGRSFDGQEPKYINSKETPLFSKKEILYGLFNAIKSGSKFKKDYVLVAEGYLDVIKLHKYDFKNAVAPLGTALTEQHIEVLSRFSPNHMLCFDGDKAGFNAALKTALIYLKNTHLQVNARFILLPQGQDPDDFLESKGGEAFDKLVANSDTLFEFLWNSAVLNKDLENPDTLVYVNKKLKEYFANIQNASVKQIYTNELEKRTKYRRRNRRGYNNNSFGKVSLSQVIKELNTAKESQETMKEKILLAYLLKQPYLVDEYNDTLCRIEIKDSTHQEIFGDLLSVSLEDGEDLNIEELFKDKEYYVYLIQKVLSSYVLSMEPQILGKDTEEVKESFEGLIESFNSKAFDEDVKLAYEDFKNKDLKSNAYSRLVNLKNYKGN